MKKNLRVKSKILFNEIIQKGKRNQNKYFVLCFENNNDSINKYGFAVGTKIGNAVLRNKIKRQLRNIVRDNYNLFPNYYNYIIMVKKDILSLSYKEMENHLIELIEKEKK